MPDPIRSHWRNGEWDLARASAENLLHEAGFRQRDGAWEGPARPEAAGWLTLLARVDVRLGRPKSALAAAQAARAAAPDPGWETAVAEGEAWLAVGEPFRAREGLSLALTRQEGPHAQVQLAIALADASRAAGHAEEAVATALHALTWAEHAMDALADDGDAAEATTDLADALHGLGQCRHAAGQEHEARRDLERARDLRLKVDPHHPDVAATLDTLGAVARARGKPFEAVKLHREAIALWIARLGEDAGPVSGSRQALAQALHRTGDFVGAHAEMARAAAATARTLGEDHVDTWIARFELGRFELDTGLVAEGLGRMAEARGVVRDRLGADHPVVKAMGRWL